MSKLGSSVPHHNYAELNQRVLDLIEGRGSRASRRLTKEMLRTFPSVVKLLPAEYQHRLQQILYTDNI